MKTAVEYLEEAIKVSSKETFYDLFEVISIAKAMEKQQSIQFAKWCDDNCLSDNYKTWEDYYDIFNEIKNEQ